MRQFIFATGFNPVYESAVAGELTIMPHDADTAETSIEACHNLILKRNADKGGDVLFPVYPKDFTAVKLQWNNANQFEAVFTVGEVDPYLDYTVTFIKKGLGFNERNKWSTVIHTTAKDTAETVATKIAKFVNDNKVGLGLTAEVNGAEVTVYGSEKGEDYAITFGDELYGTEVEITNGNPAVGDAAMIKDLFAKAAADRGYNYTYDDFDIYPGIEFNPSTTLTEDEDGWFNVYTLRFTEPRLMGTREEAVYQIIQVAFPASMPRNNWYNFLNEMVGEDIFMLEE